MSTSKSDTARANGAKSHGPITPEGKATSAANSLRHGLTAAKAIVLSNESQDEFEALRESFMERFQPADAVEAGLVESMVVSRWRLLRIAAIETGLLEEGIAMAIKYEHDHHLAYAFTTHSESLPRLTRYENSLNRAFDRALKQLQLLQRARVPAPAPLPVGSFRPLAPPRMEHPPSPDALDTDNRPLATSPQPPETPPSGCAT